MWDSRWIKDGSTFWYDLAGCDRGSKAKDLGRSERGYVKVSPYPWFLVLCIYQADGGAIWSQRPKRSNGQPKLPTRPFQLLRDEHSREHIKISYIFKPSTFTVLTFPPTAEARITDEQGRKAKSADKTRLDNWGRTVSPPSSRQGYWTTFQISFPGK